MALMKPRQPGTIEDALATIGGRLGFDHAGRAVLGHASGSRLRQCADPEQDAQISVRDAIKLDVAFVAETGEAPPILTAYAERMAATATLGPTHTVKTPAARVLEIVGEIGELSGDVERVFADRRMTVAEHAKLAKDIADAQKALTRLERDLMATLRPCDGANPVGSAGAAGARADKTRAMRGAQ